MPGASRSTTCSGRNRLHELALRLCVTLGERVVGRREHREDLLGPAGEELEERALALGGIGAEDVRHGRALLRVDVLAGRLHQLVDRGGVSLGRAPDRLGLGHMVAARVVAEQVQADLDRLGRREVLEEGRGRARLRRRVDEPEQERRRLVGKELGGRA